MQKIERSALVQAQIAGGAAKDVISSTATNNTTLDVNVSKSE
ncbi:hypothetical protein AWB78_01828 [Caballeronia calidae]|jgi:hypothetical protein|uniref:Uncharacterized protein n=1 Tax=Caballeronia calidae TaxID=1777139 RepID=A0A158AMU6_9BURK|nr:hypothetical protein AWB78_01828 [Caballeronia calidae]